MISTGMNILINCVSTSRSVFIHSSSVAVTKPFRLPFESVVIITSVSGHSVGSISTAAGDLITSSFFTKCALRALYVFFLSCRRASLSATRSLVAGALETYVLFVLMDDVSLWWLRVMVTLKVCVCCSSILSSSDTLMKGHQANARRKPARNLQGEFRIYVLIHITLHS